MLEHLTTDGFTTVPPQLAAVTSLRSLSFCGTPFQLTPSALNTLLALPRLTSLSLPKLSASGRRMAEHLRQALPGLAVKVCI